MASCGNPQDDAESLMSRRPKFDKSRTCIKCKVNGGSIVIRHAVYCRDCFVPLQTTKFKRLLEPFINPASSCTSGPRRTRLKATGNLMIGFSGGLGSTVLLDLASRCYVSASEPVDSGMKPKGTKHPRNQTVWKEAIVCYVEVCGAFPGSGMQDKTEEVRKVVEKYEGFEFVGSRIEDAFDPTWWQKVGGRIEQDLGVNISNEELLLSPLPSPCSISPLTALQAHLTSLPTTTATQSTIKTLTRLILLYTAYSTSSSHLLLGTTLTGLSVSLISGIAMGGGFVVREEAGEEWTPHINGAIGDNRSVKIVRPLRDMGMKECAAWVWWNGLDVVGKEIAVGGKQGIGELTREFIVGLEQDYPSTVSTIARTCAKLTPKDAASECCAMCERPAQKDVQDWKARISIRSLDKHSDGKMPLPPRFNQFSTTTLLSAASSLTPHLCYACHTALTSRGNRGIAHQSNSALISTTLPLSVWTNSRVLNSINNSMIRYTDGEGEGTADGTGGGKMMNASDMRDAIKDFLLDEVT